MARLWQYGNDIDCGSLAVCDLQALEFEGNLSKCFSEHNYQ